MGREAKMSTVISSFNLPFIVNKKSKEKIWKLLKMTKITMSTCSTWREMQSIHGDPFFQPTVKGSKVNKVEILNYFKKTRISV